MPGRGDPADRGSGTVLVLALAAVAVVFAAVTAALGQAVVARHRAQAAADLAALAGAAAAPGASCSAAQRIAAAGGAVLLRCAVAADGSVQVEVAVPPARGRARAGAPPR